MLIISYYVNSIKEAFQLALELESSFKGTVIWKSSEEYEY